MTQHLCDVCKTVMGTYENWRLKEYQLEAPMPESDRWGMFQIRLDRAPGVEHICEVCWKKLLREAVKG